MRKNFKAFTLVEMLIVMGIIIILMAVGIASGRYAIQRANRIEHQNAAEQIYQGLQSYYSDYREYPDKDGDNTIGTLMAGDLAEYIDDFDGGSEASYTYVVDSTGQEVLVCVTYGGNGDTNELGIYCTGNGIGSSTLTAPSVKEIEPDDSDNYTDAAALFIGTRCTNWDPSTSDWGTGDCTVTVTGTTE
jgi:type II secretory pathway pseudopilin PulG